MDIILLELILVAGVALGLGFWQLYDVNKELKKHQNQDSQKNAQRSPTPGRRDAGADDASAKNDAD